MTVGSEPSGPLERISIDLERFGVESRFTGWFFTLVRVPTKKRSKAFQVSNAFQRAGYS